MLPHLFQIHVCNQKTYIISLARNIMSKNIYKYINRTIQLHTSTAFLLIITNCSARCIKNEVNLWHKICSISSCCLILIDTLTELMDDSIKHISFSVRATITELSNNSLFPLKTYIRYYYMMQKKSIQIINSELITHFSSTSGLLCLSIF